MRRNWRLFLNTIKFLFRANVSTIGHTTRERVQQGSNLIYRIIWAIYLDSQSSSSLIFIITRKKKEREKGFRFLSMLYIPSMLGGGQWRRKMSPGRRSCSCCCCIFIQKGAKEGGEEEEEEGGKEAVPVWKKVERSGGPTDLHFRSLLGTQQREREPTHCIEGERDYTTAFLLLLLHTECLCVHIYLGSACPPTCSHTLFRYRARTVALYHLNFNFSGKVFSPHLYKHRVKVFWTFHFSFSFLSSEHADQWEKLFKEIANEWASDSVHTSFVKGKKTNNFSFFFLVQDKTRQK